MARLIHLCGGSESRMPSRPIAPRDFAAAQPLFKSLDEASLARLAAA